jgi:hypothetical protein
MTLNNMRAKGVGLLSVMCHQGRQEAVLRRSGPAWHAQGRDHRCRCEPELARASPVAAARASTIRRWFAVRLTSAGIGKHLSARGGAQRNSPSMSLLTTSIESTRLTRWNFGLVALTLLGVFAIALALMLPNTITP